MSIKELGQLIRKMRKEQKLTQEELAMASGTRERFISDLENGKETIQIGKAFSVIQSLGLKIHIER